MFLFLLVVFVLFFVVSFLVAYAATMAYAYAIGLKRRTYQYKGAVDMYIPLNGPRAMTHQTADGHTGMTEYKH